MTSNLPYPPLGGVVLFQAVESIFLTFFCFQLSSKSVASCAVAWIRLGSGFRIWAEWRLDCGRVVMVVGVRYGSGLGQNWIWFGLHQGWPVLFSLTFTHFPISNRSKTISPDLNRSKTISPNLNGSKTINPHLNGSKTINPNLNRPKTINPNLNRSKTINPKLNGSKTINPHLNRSETIRPKIGEEENEQKR